MSGWNWAERNDRLAWSTPPTKLHLEPQVVHVWLADLVVSPAQLQQFAQSLSPDEQQRAARFRFAQDRDRFTATRGILRDILSRYLAIAPHQVEFCYAERGKPALNRAVHPSRLQFNLSHSQARALYVMTAAQPVGVDLEWLRPVSDLLGLTQRFFASSEHQTIQALPVEQQARAFFQFWTCKEAVLKAIGSGLADLATVEVSFEPNGAAKLLGAGAETWQLYPLVPVADWVAAIALEPLNLPGGGWEFRFWEWSGPQMGEII